MSGLEVVAAVAGIVSAFEASVKLYNIWKEKKKQRQQHRENIMLELSLSTGAPIVKNEYDRDVKILGNRFAQGDEIARAQLYVLTVTHLQTIITLLTSSDGYRGIVMPNLTTILNTSNDTQHGAVNALVDQFQRMLQAAPVQRAPVPRTNRSSFSTASTIIPNPWADEESSSIEQPKALEDISKTREPETLTDTDSILDRAAASSHPSPNPQSQDDDWSPYRPVISQPHTETSTPFVPAISEPQKPAWNPFPSTTSLSLALPTSSIPTRPSPGSSPPTRPSPSSSSLTLHSPSRPGTDRTISLPALGIADTRKFCNGRVLQTQDATNSAATLFACTDCTYESWWRHGTFSTRSAMNVALKTKDETVVYVDVAALWASHLKPKLLFSFTWKPYSCKVCHDDKKYDMNPLARHLQSHEKAELERVYGDAVQGCDCGPAKAFPRDKLPFDNVHEEACLAGKVSNVPGVGGNKPRMERLVSV